MSRGEKEEGAKRKERKKGRGFESLGRLDLSHGKWGKKFESYAVGSLSFFQIYIQGLFELAQILRTP